MSINSCSFLMHKLALCAGGWRLGPRQLPSAILRQHHAMCVWDLIPNSHHCLFLILTIVQAQIHWFSIFNSFMMVIFLTGLVTMIMLRTLRKDYARYTQVGICL